MNRLSRAARTPDKSPRPTPSPPSTAERGMVSQRRRCSAILFLMTLVFLVVRVKAVAAPIQIAGNPQELVLSQISDRTVRVELLPLDAIGKPKPSPESTVLMAFPVTEKLGI